MVQVWDNHAHLHKDHQVKPALEMNQKAQQLPPIVYIHHGNWHIAWCLPNRGVTFATRRTNPAEYCVVRDFTNATPLSHVRASINGGFFSPSHHYKQDSEHSTKTCPHNKMIGEVGTGTKGKWERGETLKRREERWCFGMDEKGNIKALPMLYDEKTGYAQVNPEIENNFPYGLSAIGLLVQEGKAQPRPPKWGGYKKDFSALRTILAWTEKKHVFFISGGPAYWNEAANFILSLRDVIAEFLKKKGIKVNLDQFLGTNFNAVMLDGGGSVKFDYFLNPQKPSTYSGFQRRPDNAPNSQRYLTTYITAEAKFKE